ncbi:alpha/beta hydrolase [Streptomyces sp. NPDC059447]|uniref:alpha/beta hydrolase n=1 Tax=Streptomyces sp. NPDC059447 TaxID=3346834 RepID=UPI0036AFA4BE
MESHALVSAVARVWPRVPELLAGEDLERFESDVLVRLRALESAPAPTIPGMREPARAATARRDVAALFAEHPPLYAQLTEEFESLLIGVERSGAPSPPGALPYLRSLVIPVLFATDRAAEPRPPARFTGDRGELTYGKAVVGIPDDHRMGAVEKPRPWRLRFRRTADRDVLLASATTLPRPDFADTARALLSDLSRKQVLVFVHGYNVGFGAAAMRAAQIAYDLGFAGVPMLYSWPSRGSVLSYPEDENNARWSVEHFREFLRCVLTESGAEEVHVVAHSMGNRVLTEALAGFDTTSLGRGAGRLGHLVFAAPDVDAAVFRQLAPAVVRQARTCTLYASSRDRALKLSRKLAGYPRAGQSGEGTVVVKGIDTIDATALDTGLMSHSYVGDHTSVLSDLFFLLHHGRPPSERFGLSAVEHADGTYWTFRALRG